MSMSTRNRVSAEATGVMKAPFIQQAILRTRRKEQVQIRAATPRWAPRTESKKSRVAISKKPMSCFTRTIHGPGLGKNLSQAGCALKKKYGALIPRAIAPNINRITVADWVKAKPSAVPRNGAVQGVASTVANTP
jgi:hypothetical protein